MSEEDGSRSKTCTECERSLIASPEYYYHQANAPDGYTYACKECRGGSFGIHKPNHMGLADDGMIICVKCNNQYPESPEYFHRRGDGFKTTCKECRGSSFGIHDKNKVMKVPDGYKICVGCDRTLPADFKHFHRSQKTADGCQSRCKECHGFEFKISRPNRVGVADDGYWYCLTCEEQYPATEAYFYYHGSNGGTFESHCKTCSSMRKNDLRKSNKEGVVHDLSDVEWRSIKEKWACDDGFRCAYCGTVTESPERDHVSALCNGGDTTHDNIIPACGSCNRKKGPKDVAAWYLKSDVYDDVRWQMIQDHINAGS